MLAESGTWLAPTIAALVILLLALQNTARPTPPSGEIRPSPLQAAIASVISAIASIGAPLRAIAQRITHGKYEVPYLAAMVLLVAVSMFLAGLTLANPRILWIIVVVGSFFVLFLIVFVIHDYVRRDPP